MAIDKIDLGVVTLTSEKPVFTITVLGTNAAAAPAPAFHMGIDYFQFVPAP